MDLNAFLTPVGFSSLLGQLVSAENEQRKQAEAVFEQVKQQQPEACAGNLLAALRSAPEVEHRSFAAIMLRKVLVTDHQNIWGSISPSMQSNIKVELLKAVQEEQQKTVVRKVCDTVAELGAELADEEAPGATQWPELIPFMFQCVQSGQPTLMESGLLVLGLLSQCMPEAFKPQLPALVTGLGVCLSHAVRDVQLAALRASSLFIQAMDEPSERDKFQGLLEPMLACLGTTLNAGDESSAQEALEMLIEVAEAHPRFLRKSLNGVVGAMLSIARADALEAATRSLAAEFLVTLCEARDKAPGMMRKLPNFTPSLFETLMLFLLDVEDDPLWHQADDDKYEDEGAGELYNFAQDVAISLGGNAIVPSAGSLLPAWLADPDWRKRHVDMCIKGLTDPSPKVRWGACQALGQMCTDLGPTIQEKAHHGKKLVQEGALTALASVADASQTLFVKYYNTVMPLLLSILVNANDKTHRLLRGKALECISLVGMAVGKDRFREDAAKVLQFLQQLQQTEMEADDPTLGYMLQAGARLCKCLGNEFIPYLSIVMPPLIKSATIEPDITIRDAENEDDDDEDEDIEHIPMGDKMVSIRTSSLEEKATACNMLCCYADELKEGFMPYVKPVADIMVPLLKFWFHEEVRRAAVQTLPELVRSAALCVEKGNLNGVDANVMKQLVDYVWPAMMDALGKEPDADVQGTMMESICEIVELVEPTMLSQEQVASAFTRFGRILRDAEQRRSERLKRQATEDFDQVSVLFDAGCWVCASSSRCSPALGAYEAPHV
ncbi:armadillo-type protein [Dunaliella salina]|uniref:Armadillo-type protein n=1 Tax=Dunaliella salina TaxID=3046 RepID=A0ABQ7GYB8_DUNSA|nr:armadillo-type protein [Dunaliella salina]|eukprot:KAF5839603.1 armadillo-type protein [Dunaliella salina]